jgi:hypothetical protein
MLKRGGAQLSLARISDALNEKVKGQRTYSRLENKAGFHHFERAREFLWNPFFFEIRRCAAG